MDKRKVIAAYRRGFITIKECAQILGIDSPHILSMVNESAVKSVKVSNTPLTGNN